MQQLMHATLQHMNSNPTCSAEHHCLSLAQARHCNCCRSEELPVATDIGQISVAIGRLPELQQGSCDLGEPSQQNCRFCFLKEVQACTFTFTFTFTLTFTFTFPFTFTFTHLKQPKSDLVHASGVVPETFLSSNIMPQGR